MSNFDPNSKLVKTQNIEKEWADNKQPEPQKDKPKVIPDVDSPVQKEAPSEESIRIEQKLKMLRNEMNEEMRNFNNLFKVSTLPANKSEEDKQSESKIFNEIIRKCNLLNEISPNEGNVSLLVLCLRHLLSLRNAGNKLAYQIYELEKQVFGETTEDKVRKEKLLKKRAKIKKLQEEVDVQLKRLEEE